MLQQWRIISEILVGKIMRATLHGGHCLLSTLHLLTHLVPTTTLREGSVKMRTLKHRRLTSE